MSEPVRLGDVAMQVLRELLDRECPVTQGVSEAFACDNGEAKREPDRVNESDSLAIISSKPKEA